MPRLGLSLNSDVLMRVSYPSPSHNACDRCHATGQVTVISSELCLL